MFKKTLPLLLIPTLATACDQGAGDLPGVEPEALGAPSGKADGPEVKLGSSGSYDVLQISGEAAVDLYGVLDDAGGLSRASQNGLDYVYGSYTICVSNGQAAACNLYSRDARIDGVEPFQATTHGERFASASSELFGAIARSQGIAPSSVDVARSGRFVCGKTSDDVWCGLEAPTSVNETVLAMTYEGLPPLGDDFVYEGWLITADGPITSGRFEIAEGQDSVQMGIDPELAAASTLFVLTIEPKFGDDPAPSDTHIVAGPFVDGVAVLDTVHGAALGTDFLDSAGRFFLQTPSTADIAEDYRQGVWFLDPAEGVASLELPELPAGWAYEGWVVGDDGPISTGRFVDPGAEDRDGAGPTAGPDGTPPFPGQDFINPAIDLEGHKVVISVEPDPDDSPLPFALKPLAGDVVDAGPGVLQPLGNIAATNRITGLAAFE